MIVPSVLQRTAGIVEKTIIINPGRLAQGKSGGTFCNICIHSLDARELINGSDDLQDGASKEAIFVEHHVPDRARVDIIRI